MPPAVLRIVEGFLFFVCAGGLFVSVIVLAATGVAPLNLFGQEITPLHGGIAALVMVLGMAWFGFHAITDGRVSRQ